MTRGGLRAAIALLPLILGIASCSSKPVRDAEAESAENAAIARSVHATAVTVAVSSVGTQVCRRARIGISEFQWLRGVVIETGSGRIRVRIDDPGRYPQTIDGTLIARGVLLWEDPLDWTPCR